MANRRYIDFPIASTSGDTDIILIWQDGANKQTTKATFLSGLPENLDELNDVAISGLTNGQILRYDSVTGKWENTDQGNLDLNDLNDVSIVSPSNGQVLVYNSSTSKWENSSGGYVPYVGAVTTVDLGAQGLRAGYVRFDTTVASVPNEQGLMFWDADDETVDIILNGYTMKIGEDLFYPVKNQTGSTIAKGVAVRFNGTVGNSGRLLIAPFIADGSVASSRFMGVTAEEILNGEDGKVLYFGRIRGINTNAFNEGDILYASTTVAGGYQTAIPVAPNNIVQVAAVVTKSSTVGTIFVRPTLGSNINKDEGVKIVSVADKNLLQYQSGTSLWENKSLAQVLGGTSAQFVKGDGSLDSNTYGTGTVTSVGLSSATSGVTIGSTPVTTSGTITLAIATASGSQNGLLSSTDWTTFNSKVSSQWITSGSDIYYNAGKVAIGTSMPSTTFGGLDISSGGIGLILGADFNAITRTNSTTKSFRVGGYHYTNSESAFAILTGASTSTSNEISIGGGTASMNAATNITFITAANNTTITGTERMTITSNGNVGIGLNNPSSLLHIFGAGSGNSLTYTKYTCGDGGDIRVGKESGVNNDAIFGTWSNNSVLFYANATESMRIFASKNLHIGPTPASDNGARLQVSGTASFTGALTGTSATFTGNILLSGSGAYVRASTTNGFLVNNNNDSLNLFIVTNAGNVGIGTTSPSSNLQVQSTSSCEVRSFSTSTGDYANFIVDTDNTINYRLQMVGFGTTASGTLAGISRAGNGFLVKSGGLLAVGTRDSNALVLSTNEAERMRINSSGFLKVSNNSVYESASGGYHELNQSNTSATLLLATHRGSDPYGIEVQFTGADPNNATNYMFGAYKTSGGFVWIYRIFSNGTVSARSDARWKKNIETTRNGYIDDLCKLRVVKYNWYNHEDNTPKELGLIAQEVEEVFPNLIQIDPVIAKREVEQEDGTIIEEEYEDGVSRSIKTSVLPFMLLKAMQEQQEQIKELKKEIETLKNQMQ